MFLQHLLIIMIIRPIRFCFVLVLVFGFWFLFCFFVLLLFACVSVVVVVVVVVVFFSFILFWNSRPHPFQGKWWIGSQPLVGSILKIYWANSKSEFKDISSVKVYIDLMCEVSLILFNGYVQNSRCWNKKRWKI